eukprot:NODE_1682_length_771_cov_20.468944_g1633_i0.p1 GENE.NODE_1682_length_771_cov_20.468944_g1633_i0~~NODE_1682_length_771_cov_20.468944_g1633_i0.p1  ORF type:complete len:248 (+),score=69.87 NODE_1682_length_771_cov_20.468944_g1633_i0:77-745(+)
MDYAGLFGAGVPSSLYTPLSGYPSYAGGYGTYGGYNYGANAATGWGTLQSFGGYPSYTSVGGYPSFAGTWGGYGLAQGRGTTFDPFAAAPALTAPAQPSGTSTASPAAAAPTAPAPAPAAQSTHVVLSGDARVQSEKRTEAISAVRALVSASRREKGCVKFEWAQSLSDPTLLVIYECWETENDMDAHLDSDHVRDFKEVVQDLFAVDPAVQKANVTAWEDI